MKRSLFSTILITTLLSSGIVFAQGSAPSREQREEMAKHHENMAACLRSDKSMEDCHNEMRKFCDMKSGEHGCYMMDGMHGNKRGKTPKK